MIVEVEKEDLFDLGGWWERRLGHVATQAERL